jgi:hypothetical protein
MFCSFNNVVLQFFRKIAEVGTVSSDAHQQIFLTDRVCLRRQQSLAVDDIELQMPKPKVAPRTDNIDEFISTRVPSHALGRKFDVQQARGAVGHSIVFAVIVREQD